MNSGMFDLVRALKNRELHMGDPNNKSTSFMSINDIYKAKNSDSEDPTKYPAW